MVGMKSISFESLDGLVNEMRAAETIRRLRCHLGNLLIDRIDRIDLPISGNGSYLGFSFVFINRKDAETNSRPCLETVSAVHSAAAHGHRPLASLEILRKSVDANVYVSFLPTVAVPGSDCAIFERVYRAVHVHTD